LEKRCKISESFRKRLVVKELGSADVHIERFAGHESPPTRRRNAAQNFKIACNFLQHTPCSFDFNCRPKLYCKSRI
jgi:hypothetical protein